MNSQNSFSKEEKKEGLSTPKFQRNLSIYSLEKEENTLDTLQQNINILVNLESKSNLDKQNNNEFQNKIINNNFALKSLLLNEINNKNELYDNYNQFSFDGKTKNIDNNVIIIDNNTNNENDNNNEIKYISEEESNIINSNSKNNENNENIDFNYNLPLESDKSSENFNLISFQAFSEEIDEKKNEKNKKIPNQKKMNLDRKINNNPKIINKKRNIGYFSKQKKISKKLIIKDILNLTPKKSNKNNNSLNKSAQKSKSNFNSMKKRNFCIEIPSLIEEYKTGKCLTEPKNPFFEFNSVNVNNSLKNTNFTSKEKKSIVSLKKENKNRDINPFIVKKISFNNNTTKIKKDESKNNKIEKINISYYKKRNPKLRKSIHFKKGYTFIENNNNIYDKNTHRNKDINIKEKNNLIHSRNYNQLNNQNINLTYDNSPLKTEIKKSIFLLNNNNLNKSPFYKRKISYRNFAISDLDSSSKRLLKTIKHKKIIDSPFNKFRILNKNSLSKKFIFNNQSSSAENRKIKIKLNKNEKYDGNDTFISSNEIKSNHKFTIFCNYDSKKPKTKNVIKEKNLNSEINKIKVSTISNSLNNNTKLSQKNTNYMNYKNNRPNKLKIDKRRIIKERYKNSFREPSSIYSKKFVFINNNNSNSNLYSTINNENKPKNQLKNKIVGRNINKSLIINSRDNNFITDKNSTNSSLIIKDKNRFNDIFYNILSNLELKNINNNKKKTINSFKKIKFLNETYNTLNSNTENIYSRENNILSNYKIHSFKPKIKHQNKITKKSEKINKQYNTINNNSINIGNNDKFRKNPKISKRKIKLNSKRENSLNIPKIKNRIEKYSILNNNQNNKIRNEISIYFEKQSNKKEKSLKLYNGDEYIKKKKEKSLIKNGELKKINDNEKTIINVNLYKRVSYFGYSLLFEN